MDAQHVALTLFRIADGGGGGGQLENNFQNDVHVSFPKNSRTCSPSGLPQIYILCHSVALSLLQGNQS